MRSQPSNSGKPTAKPQYRYASVADSGGRTSTEAIRRSRRLRNIVANEKDAYGGVDPCTLPWRTFSEKFQLHWVMEVLGNRSGGFYIDLAAHDARTYSNTYILDRCFDWSGLCVEANPEYFEGLSKYRTCQVFPVAVSNERGWVEFVFSGGLGGIVADDTDNNKKIRGGALNKVMTYKLLSTTLLDVLKEGRAPKVIDYFSFDIEGAEERVLRDFPLDEYIFLTMTIERPTPELNKLLLSSGYLYVKTTPKGCKPEDCNESYYIHKSLETRLGRQIPKEPFKQTPRKVN